MSNISEKENNMPAPEIETAIAGAIAAYLGHDRFQVLRIEEFESGQANCEEKKSFWSQNIGFLLTLFGSRKDTE